MPSDYEKLATELWDSFDFLIPREGVIAHIAQALRTVATQARNEALEEAAKAADGWKSPLKPGTQARKLGHDEAARNIAAVIRALKRDPGGQ